MNTSRMLNMLGFAMRAGRLVIGTELICKAMAKKKDGVRLVLICADSSEPTKKKLTVKAEYYGLPVILADITQDDLGQAIGKDYSPAAVAITDEGFARQIAECVNNTHRKDISHIGKVGGLNGSR